MIFTKNQTTFLLILIAFAFSFAVRLIWVEQFSGAEQFRFNNEFMINTNDGYFYAEGARDIIAGKTESTNDRAPITSAGSILTASIAKIIPLPFETIIFYMPAFFASLLVIPLILIGRTFGRIEVGFMAALIGSIAWSYYNRTMVGYFDTDLLNIVLPTILLWSIIWAVQTQKEEYLLLAALDSIVYRWWYPQSYALEFAFVGLILAYVVYQFLKKEDFKSNLLLVTFMIMAFVNIDNWINFSLVVILYIILKIKKEQVYKYVYYLFGLAVVLFFMTGGFSPIWGLLKVYVFTQSVTQSNAGLGLHFFSVIQTVREAGQIPFETFANRISGHTITLILGVLGYIWFAFKHKVMLFALPMLGLGFLALSSGLRFTVYAVPIVALGTGYIIYKVSVWLSERFIDDKVASVAKYIFMALFTVGALYPNVSHVIDYKVPTVFNKTEVEVLDKLKSIATREDYVVGWWDYGYPLRYYSDVKTLVDGGKHSGAVNFPVSYILNSPQKEAATMARLDVEYTEERFTLREKNIKWASSNVEQMTLDYNFTNSNQFLDSLKNDIKLPEKTRDVYLYLPFRMMNILPTVKLFSNMDLMTGEKKTRPFFYQSRNFRETPQGINLGNGIVLNNKTGSIQIGKNSLRINNFIVTMYDQNGKLQKQVQTLDRGSPINVIFMKNYNTFLVLDSEVFNSTYIQMFVLENYDKKLFEPVILNPQAKVYKLKI